MCARAVALCCALLVALGTTAAYTVDCNHEYTDCDTELGKIASEDEDLPALKSSIPVETTTTSTTTESPPSTPKKEIENHTEKLNTEVNEPKDVEEVKEEVKPKARLLNLNVDELQNFANALHNQTDNSSSKKLTDLSDVNLDDDDEEPPRIHQHHKDIPDKFYSNLQAPFHPLMPDRGSEEEMCKENEISYKIGEKIDRACEETCECGPNGIFECSPRCKHPYIRRGRRLNDPLCFESPVDECCSIIACSTGNGANKPVKLEVCKYANETYTVGAQWFIGCEQSCVCEPNSVVTCKPRCKPLSPSDKCINVQDPKDACCEVQVCDVSQDDHELSVENVTSTTPPSPSQSPRDFEHNEEGRSSLRPLVLAEPIGSIKVLQNNSVQVNLMHPNNTQDPIHLLLSDDGGKTFQDVELMYSNLILNLDGGKDYILKTKETGTKFNFTITASDIIANEVPSAYVANDTKVGCWEDGKFYEIGEEFRIGCTELCECTGPDTRECAALVCPNHVGLEIMSKGCVKWAPSPPAKPPNCCPRSARCLSDGTCHYNGVPVPNWSEVPISLTGCEQRCFCENGDLDCQEVCTPLPTVPPPSFRCPPLHRPAAVNISDEDCCKQWGCVPSGTKNGSTPTYSMPIEDRPVYYVTPISPILPTVAPVLPTPPLATDSLNTYFKQNSFKTIPKFMKTVTHGPISNIASELSEHENQIVNVTVFSFKDSDHPYKPADAGPALDTSNDLWIYTHQPMIPKVSDSSAETHRLSHASHSHSEKHINFVLADSKMHGTHNRPLISHSSNHWEHDYHSNDHPHEPIRKDPISSIDKLSFFVPSHNEEAPNPITYYESYTNAHPKAFARPTKISLFEPAAINRSSDYLLSKPSPPDSLLNEPQDYSLHGSHGKHVTVLKTKDLRPTNFDGVMWSQGTKTHVLTKQPNPYETVLLRAVPSPKADFTPKLSQKSNGLQVPSKYSKMDLENLLTQMEIQSEVNRNLGRSADKNRGTVAAGHQQPDFPRKPQPPSFLPTIPPEIHYPQEEDYDQNNIHRPLEPSLPGLPPGLQVPPSFGDMNKKLAVISIEADSPTSIKMLLGLPPVLVGLRGSVDLRYTDKADEDVTHWYSQVFAPADEILTTPRLEFRLTGLKPSTMYRIRGKLYLHNLPVTPESETYSVRTQDVSVVEPVEEKRREIDSQLTVVNVNDTTAHVSWRHFNEDELMLIDGIQVRFRPVGTPIYSMTEVLHHSRSAAELHDLRPGSRYEASLVLIPPPRATTELHDPGRVEFTTLPYIDPYNWTVTIEVRSIGAEAAELTWHGVPSPAERWVRVYRAAHACGEQQTGKEHDVFRLAARDQPPTVTLSGLEPETRCRVWLEVFLTNGKVKTSNVLEINTKSLDTDNPIDNEIEASSHSDGRGRERPRGDYYTALVGVGVVAALGALTSLLLLLVVVRRHRPRSVSITPVPSAPRESSLPPYDNPAYKLELQQETMDL